MVFFQHSGDSIELLFHVIYSNDPSQSFYDSGALSPFQHVHCSGSGDVLQSAALFSFVKTKGTLFSVCVCAFILVLPPLTSLSEMKNFYAAENDLEILSLLPQNAV